MISLKWIMIIVLHGWGAGVGSTGNAVATVEFASQETCESAATKLSVTLKQDVRGEEGWRVLCVQK